MVLAAETLLAEGASAVDRTEAESSAEAFESLLHSTREGLRESQRN